jgi:hypothetical protein
MIKEVLSLNKKRTFYILHTIILLFYLYFAGLIITSLESYAKTIIDPRPLIIGKIIIFIILGCILGLEHLITECKKEGSWQINNKAMFSLVPILIILLAMFLWGCGLIPFPMVLLKENIVIYFLPSLFGYQFITCIIKEPNDTNFYEV